MSSNDDRDRGPESHDAGYWSAVRRPLQILAFLLPLVIAYEICLAVLLPAADGLRVNTVEAHRTLLTFFATFGLAPGGGLYLGGVAIVVVLLVWHVLARDAWHVDWGLVPLMALEALVLALPLLVAAHLLAEPTLTAAVPAAPGFADLDIWSQMAISVGAGLYEELIFRMVLIALVHTLLVDLGRVPGTFGAVVAIAVSAVAFTLYHDLRTGAGELAPRRVAFYLLAGTYFGVIYWLRGFGLVVGAHALYDIVTVMTATGDA